MRDLSVPDWVNRSHELGDAYKLGWADCEQVYDHTYVRIGLVSLACITASMLVIAVTQLARL